MTRILAFSDLHLCAQPDARDIVEALHPEADLVIGAGDFCNARVRDLDEAMELLCDRWPTRRSMFPGNAESAEELARRDRGDRAARRGQLRLTGMKIFGIGYAIPVTPFGAWSCDLDRGARG